MLRLMLADPRLRCRSPVPWRRVGSECAAGPTLAAGFPCRFVGSATETTLPAIAGRRLLSLRLLSLLLLSLRLLARRLLSTKGEQWIHWCTLLRGWRAVAETTSSRNSMQPLVGDRLLTLMLLMGQLISSNLQLVLPRHRTLRWRLLGKSSLHLWGQQDMLAPWRRSTLHM